MLVVGFSTGATLALYLTSHRPVSRLVLLAPFLAIRYTGLFPVRPELYLRPLARVIPNLPRRPPAIRDAEMRRWASAQSHFRTFSIPAALSAFELIDTVKPLVPGITAPALIMQGQLDTVIEPAGAAWLHANLGSTDRTIVSLARTDHVVALDRERRRSSPRRGRLCWGGKPRSRMPLLDDINKVSLSPPCKGGAGGVVRAPSTAPIADCPADRGLGVWSEHPAAPLLRPGGCQSLHQEPQKNQNCQKNHSTKNMVNLAFLVSTG